MGGVGGVSGCVVEVLGGRGVWGGWGCCRVLRCGVLWVGGVGCWVLWGVLGACVGGHKE